MEKGFQQLLKYIVVVTVLITCLYVALNQTGFFAEQQYIPYTATRPVIVKNSSKPQLNYQPPVVPVNESDWTEHLPTYKDIPNDVYKTDWWMSAAFLQWDLEHRKTDVICEKIKSVGNWHICLDDKYQIKSPCLVYSFGIANDFSFDDDMAKYGCEVHSFDPSMKTNDYTRTTGVHFHAIGLSNYNDDKFLPRKDIYVKDDTTWTIMTLNLIKTALGHKNRRIDVLKMDVEGHEWAIIDNLLQDKMFPTIKQFMLEYHLFPDWPLKSEYSKLLRTYKTLHDIGYQKYHTHLYQGLVNHKPEAFNIQADVAYVNTNYESP